MVAAVILTQLLLLGILVVTFSFLLQALYGVPWVRTPRRQSRAMFELAGLKPGERVLDLGAGDGSVVIEAAHDFNASGVGIEWQRAFVLIARLRAWYQGVSDRVTVKRANIFKTELPEADVIFTFLLPRVNARIEPILKKRYPSGTRLVSRAFRYPTLPLVAKSVSQGDTIYLYHIP